MVTQTLTKDGFTNLLIETSRHPMLLSKVERLYAVRRGLLNFAGRSEISDIRPYGTDAKEWVRSEIARLVEELCPEPIQIGTMLDMYLKDDPDTGEKQD